MSYVLKNRQPGEIFNLSVGGPTYTVITQLNGMTEVLKEGADHTQTMNHYTYVRPRQKCACGRAMSIRASRCVECHTEGMRIRSLEENRVCPKCQGPKDEYAAACHKCYNRQGGLPKAVTRQKAETAAALREALKERFERAFG